MSLKLAYTKDGDRLSSVDVVFLDAPHGLAWLWIPELPTAKHLNAELWIVNDRPGRGNQSTMVCPLPENRTFDRLAVLEIKGTHFEQSNAYEVAGSLASAALLGYARMGPFLSTLGRDPARSLLRGIAEHLAHLDPPSQQESLSEWLQSVPITGIATPSRGTALVGSVGAPATMLSGLEAAISALPTETHREIGRTITFELLSRFKEELLPLLGGEKVSLRYDRVEGIASLMYASVDRNYVGIDSLVPSAFEAIHPFLLDHITLHLDGPSSPECYGKHVVRVLPLRLDRLVADYKKNPVIVDLYFRTQAEHRILLFQVDPSRAKTLLESAKMLWSTDVALWKNLCALVFQSSGFRPDRMLDLQLFVAGSPGFAQAQRYIEGLLAQATLLNMEFPTIARQLTKGRDLTEADPALDKLLHDALVSGSKVEQIRRTIDDVLWSLNDLFEPELRHRWPEFVDAEKRLQQEEASFLEMLLGSLTKDVAGRKVRVLDAAGGIGCEAVFLAMKGAEVWCNEIDAHLRQVAEERARQQSAEVKFSSFDWRHFDTKLKERFDLVLVVGNSLSCLDSRDEMKAAIKGFSSVLRPNGYLVIDERNYEDMITRRSEMESDDFLFPGNVIYCGEIKAKPSKYPATFDAPARRLELSYFGRDRTRIGTFTVYPFREGEVRALLEEAKFEVVSTLWDLKETTNSQAEFLTYVARKPS